MTDGRSRDYPIDLPSLVIGRADGNSIVIDDLSVARRHARLVIDSGRLMVEDLGSASGTFIDGQRIPPSTLSLVGDDQVVRFGDVEAQYTAPHDEEDELPRQPTSLPFAGQVPVVPPQAAVGLRVVLSVPPQPIQPGGAPAEATLVVQNLGRLVDELAVVVEDLPTAWVKVGLPRLVLRPGEQAEVPITIAPPRQSSSRAGDYDFNVSVTSRETGREGVANGRVVVLPFEDTKLALQPVRAKRNFRLTATNDGNAHATYALSGVDDEEAFDYNFAKPNLELAAGQSTSLPFKVNRRRHALFGAATAAPFVVVATPTTDRGTKAEVRGQLVVAPPLEPTKRPAMMMAVLALLVLGALAFFLLPSDKEVKAVGTEDAYAGVHLCDKDGKPTDALKQEEAAATSTTTASGGEIPKSSNTSGGPYFAQNDPRWANDEYAKAGDPQFGPDWCGTTIAQCGCAMTSVTTVMALYNILTMPDGSDLTHNPSMTGSTATRGKPPAAG